MPRTTTPIEVFSDRMDRKLIQSKTHKGEVERLNLLQKFPLEDWDRLPLECYAYGPTESPDTYSSMLENDTNNAVTFDSHGSKEFKIYFSQVEKRWWYLGQFRNEQDAWRSIRQNYLSGFSMAKDGRWNHMHSLNTNRYGAKALLKTLICYFPDHLLPITSNRDIARFLVKLGVVDFDATAKNTILLNRLLLLKLRDKAALKNLQPAELKHLLFDWSPPGG